MEKILYVFLAGGVGSTLRYLLSMLTTEHIHLGTFPLGTFLCNILGCLLIGLFNSLSAHCGWSQELRLMLTVGLCGGLTTFSTFTNESYALILSGDYLTYALYLILTLAIGLLAVVIGMAI